MKRPSKQLSIGKPGRPLKLKAARVRLSLRPGMVMGEVFASAVGPKAGAIRFTFVPDPRTALATIESLEFELSRDEAWFLGEWMTNESIRAAPKSR